MNSLPTSLRQPPRNCRPARRGKSSEAGQQSADRDDAGDEASGDSDEPAAIASIVDSVLAELKPKLVEEIARKMNSDKKAKAKKNKK